MHNYFACFNRVNITPSLAVIIETPNCHVIPEHIEGWIDFEYEKEKVSHGFTYFFSGDKKLLEQMVLAQETKDWLQCSVINALIDYVEQISPGKVSKLVVRFNPDLKPFTSVFP